MTQCIGRISKVDGIHHFKEGRHRFYLEYRCSNNVIPHTNNCARCTDRSRDKIQSSGKYDHGNVNEPIPIHSQIYGGKWYTDGCVKWGVPRDEDIKKAEEHRDVARAEFAEHTIINVATTTTVATVATSIQPRKRTIKRNDNPAVAVSSIYSVPIVPIEPVEPDPATASTASLATASTASLATAPLIQPRKRVKPKPIPKPQIESIIATHIENEIEEFCIDDYEIEYVKLTPFEHNDISYFREPIKNKLFERKSKTIGAYIGRYDSYTDTIRTDIPDSDSED